MNRFFFSEWKGKIFKKIETFYKTNRLEDPRSFFHTSDDIIYTIYSEKKGIEFREESTNEIVRPIEEQLIGKRINLVNSYFNWGYHEDDNDRFQELSVILEIGDETIHLLWKMEETISMSSFIRQELTTSEYETLYKKWKKSFPGYMIYQSYGS